MVPGDTHVGEAMVMHAKLYLSSGQNMYSKGTLHLVTQEEEASLTACTYRDPVWPSSPCPLVARKVAIPGPLQ